MAYFSLYDLVKSTILGDLLRAGESLPPHNLLSVLTFACSRLLLMTTNSGLLSAYLELEGKYGAPKRLLESE